MPRGFCVGLAVTLSELESEKHIVVNDPEKLKVLFLEMTQMCLWCVLNPVTQHRRSEPTAPGETPLLSFSARRWLGRSDGLVHQDLSLLTNMTPEDIEHLQKQMQLCYDSPGGELTERANAVSAPVA